MDIVNVSLDFHKPFQRIVKVTIKWFPVSTKQSISIPRWTPGSYTIRDHSQNIFDISLKQNSENIKLNRFSSSTWNTNVEPLKELVLEYFVICTELSVRTSFIDNQFASLCLSSLLMLIEEKRYSSYSLSLISPQGWENHTTLDFDKFYLAKDYDQLVDSPIHSGIFDVKTFYISNVKHEIISYNIPDYINNTEFIENVKSILKVGCSLYSTPRPVANKYQIVILFIKEMYGGLEHDNSTVLHFDWRKIEEIDSYRELLQLIGHEYYHQWNIRRMRPAEYIIYNYDQEVLSDSLWFVEGVTSYFDICMPYLSGFSNLNEYLKDLSKDINYVLNSPGLFSQSLSDSCLEAWIKLYKSKPHSFNTQISYYKLGTLLALTLDIELRRNNSSLSELVLLMWNEYGTGEQGYNRDDIIRCINKLSSSSQIDLNKWLDIPSSIPFEEKLSYLGIILTKKEITHMSYGLKYYSDNGRIFVLSTKKYSCAEQAGLIKDDEILSIDLQRINSEKDLIRNLNRKQKLQIIISRQDIIKKLSINQPSTSYYQWDLRTDETQSKEQAYLMNKWLKFN